jgi:guanylate kinase
VIETKKILAIIGCSASGKTTLGIFLEELEVPQIISHTTRKPRKNEIPNQTYYYITKEEFDSIDKLEQTCYSGNYYCLSRQEVERHKEDLAYCIVTADGAEQIRVTYGEENVIVICIHINLTQMQERLTQRGDTKNEIKKRIENAINTDEINTNLEIADFIIMNNNLDKSKQILEFIVNSIREMEDE